jgi:uncharacterized protein YgiM (DUF1202 family)
MRVLAIVILVTGFILGGWATASAEAGAAAERPGKVTADRLNLRGSPSTTGDVVGSMARDDTVTIIEEQGEWYRLRLENGQTGWAAKKFVQVVTDNPTENSETSGTPAPKSSGDGAKEAVTKPAAKQGGGGGSFIGAVFKWGCLLGAGACGYLAYSENSKGNDLYDDYKAEYARLVKTGHTTAQALNRAEPLRLDAKDHDKKSETYQIAGGGLLALFLVQEFFFNKHHDQAATQTNRSPDQPLLACGLRQGQLRAAVTLARF